MEWLEKTHSQNRTQFDSEVILSIEKREKYNYVLFRFRKNSIYKIISKEDFIIVARDGNNIYFKESDAKRGFKVSNWTERVKSFKVVADRLKLKDEDSGEYNLEFDSKLGLHYICLYRKLEKTLNWESK